MDVYLNLCHSWLSNGGTAQHLRPQNCKKVQTFAQQHKMNTYTTAYVLSSGFAHVS